MEKMKILVTGGAGFIGSQVVKKLLGDNYEVVVYDSLVNGHREFVPEKAKFVKGDLYDMNLLESVFNENNFDAVMHFAGFTSMGESVENPMKYFKNNIVNGLNILNVCVKNGVKKFIFSSSAGVYGTPENLPITESENRKPENPYGETKLIFENFLKSYDKAYGLKSVCLRYFNASGADRNLEIGEDHTPETHLIPLILDVALGRRDSINIFGTDYDTKDGPCIRDYVHVEDLANAHIKALEKIKR